MLSTIAPDGAATGTVEQEGVVVAAAARLWEFAAAGIRTDAESASTPAEVRISGRLMPSTLPSSHLIASQGRALADPRGWPPRALARATGLRWPGGLTGATGLFARP